MSVEPITDIFAKYRTQVIYQGNKRKVIRVEEKIGNGVSNETLRTSQEIIQNNTNNMSKP